MCLLSSSLRSLPRCYCEYSGESLLSSLTLFAARRRFVAFAAFLSHKPFTKPASGVFGVGVIFGCPLAVMSLKPIIFLWASGFIATALQGVSHRETKEPPTMPHLANISNELAHSTFFPCLLLQACLAQITGSDSKKKKA